jgi:uncharacterized protein (UPF0333 family)
MIAIYTLSNGEQIIGEWNDGSARTTVIVDPFYIVETQDEFGNNGMKLINVCTFSTQQYIVVDNTNVVFSMPANEPMTRYYNKLVEASKKADTYKMIEDSIRDMEDMEATLRETISKRLVGGSTIN